MRNGGVLEAGSLHHAPPKVMQLSETLKVLSGDQDWYRALLENQGYILPRRGEAAYASPFSRLPAASPAPTAAQRM